MAAPERFRSSGAPTALGAVEDPLMSRKLKCPSACVLAATDVHFSISAPFDTDFRQQSEAPSNRTGRHRCKPCVAASFDTRNDVGGLRTDLTRAGCTAQQEQLQLIGRFNSS